MQKKNSKKSVRLTKNVVPISYHIELKPDLENFTFSGIEHIALSILKPTKTITLHSKEVEIITADIEKSFAKINYNKKSETATFTFSKIIPKGKHKLSLVFKGILNDKMRGFYRSKYFVNGKERHMATTQFEATDARKAFPCFDEPAHKAVFHVSLIVPKGKTAISNTLPISVGEHESGFEIIKFAPTPKMSTYLLAFIVGDFEYIEKKSSRGVIVRVYTTPGKIKHAKFALDVTVRTLEFYEKYFDIPYPLDTLDMIALPDFSSLAMENWGAITFREVGLLVDEKNSSTETKELVVEVIAHELAHQWFGNLVTMEWWTHLWLNEGFASYIPFLVTDKLFPKWNIWERFNIEKQGVALRLDALASTHPIEVEVHHPDEIGEIFDAVSYCKGASIIRMLAEYLGEKDFRDGLRYYLKKHSYQNTETIHLWQAFEKVSGKPVARMMHNWTAKPGYLVVKLKVESGKLKVSQERFFSSPISAKKAKDKTKWDFPLNFKNGKANFGETGFYRVAYSKELLEKLYKPVANKTLKSWDRLGIVRDLFATAEAGTIPTTDALEFLSAYKGEDNYIVWLEIAMGLTKLKQLFPEDRLRGKLSDFISSLFSPVALKLGWHANKSESNSVALLRSLAISVAGRNGNEKIITEAKKKFASSSHLSPDIREAVYSIVAANGGIREYQTFIRMYQKESLHEEKNRIGGALGSFSSPAILRQVCKFALSKNVRPQDTIGILSAVGANPKGRDIWWSFMQKNWKTMVSRYGEGGLSLGRAVTAISGSAEPRHLSGLKKFFRTHSAPGAKRSLEQVFERIESNIEWKKRDGKIVEGFLRS